jgi:hypothetical protein
MKKMFFAALIAFAITAFASMSCNNSQDGPVCGNYTDSLIQDCLPGVDTTHRWVWHVDTTGGDPKLYKRIYNCP